MSRSGGLASVMEKPQHIGSSACYMQLKREERLLHTAEQRGRAITVNQGSGVHGIQLNQGDKFR